MMLRTQATVEKYDPTNEEFDPNRHNVVFQVPDPTKDPDTVAVVLKVCYQRKIHKNILFSIFIKTFTNKWFS